MKEQDKSSEKKTFMKQIIDLIEFKVMVTKVLTELGRKIGIEHRMSTK